VFAALAIARTMQNRSGLALRRILRILRPLRSATIRVSGVTVTIPQPSTPKRKPSSTNSQPAP